MRFLRACRAAALSAFVVSVVACSSADFSVAPAREGGVDSDAGVDRCAPSPGLATFCMNVTPSTPHPIYDAAAVPLGIDGKGVVHIFFFNQDPALVTSQKPIEVIYPSDGTQVDVDKDFPLVVPGAALPGQYWMVAVFEDNPEPRGTDIVDPTVPGDFVSVPVVNPDDKMVHYPTVQFEIGKTKTVDLPIRPIRRLGVDFSADRVLDDLHAKNPAIHGDGPTELLLYDGDLTASPTIRDADLGDCIRLFDQPRPIHVDYKTTAEGTHNVLAVLYDYMYPDASDRFPGRGSIIRATRVAKSVDLPTSSWSSQVELAFNAVEATGPGDVDKLHCNGTAVAARHTSTGALATPVHPPQLTTALLNPLP
ncbi:MAG: hypothetical protein NVSMB47_10150 [Polyangiales bacterium]